MIGCSCWEGGTDCLNVAADDSPDGMCDECEHGYHEHMDAEAPDDPD